MFYRIYVKQIEKILIHIPDKRVITFIISYNCCLKNAPINWISFEINQPNSRILRPE